MGASQAKGQRMAEEVLKELIEKNANRRSFVRKLGLASAAVGVASALKPSEAGAATTISDADILNFALNLEFLEAEFYSVATTGKTVDQFGITISGTGTAGATTGGSQVTFSDTTTARVAEELAEDERTHVALLQDSLTAAGASPIAKPAINLNALGFGFGSQADFLKLARIFEDIGVTAYGGAAPLITSSTILGVAARILATEAEHAGAIRLLVSQNNIATTALDSADFLPPPSGSQFFSTDNNALTAVRTPGQVLLLAYAAANVSSGGFFPGGVNGSTSLNTSASSPAADNGTRLLATPNPIPVASGQVYAATTLVWNAPSAQYIQIRIGSPTGPLFTTNTNSGAMGTNSWVTDGMTFYLQDISNGKALTAANTMATLVVHFM